MSMPVVQSIYTCVSLIYIVIKLHWPMQVVFSKLGTIHDKPRIEKSKYEMHIIGIPVYSHGDLKLIHTVQHALVNKSVYRRERFNITL